MVVDHEIIVSRRVNSLSQCGLMYLRNRSRTCFCLSFSSVFSKLTLKNYLLGEIEWWRKEREKRVNIVFIVLSLYPKWYRRRGIMYIVCIFMWSIRIRIEGRKKLHIQRLLYLLRISLFHGHSFILSLFRAMNYVVLPKFHISLSSGCLCSLQ